MKDSYNINKNGRENVIEICTNFIKSGIINDIDQRELLEYIAMTKQQKKEQELLKQHIDNFYHIWQNDKGRYLTYLPASDKPRGRKPVTATTKEKLERKIIDFYLDLEKQEQSQAEKQQISTLKDIYPKWLEVKTLETTATGYIRRIDADWLKFYANDPIITKDIQSLSKTVLKEWALKKVRDNSLTKTQYYNMSVIIRQSLDWCVEHELLAVNPFRQFTIDGKLFVKKKKPDDSTQVFLIDERPAIEAEAWKDFYKKDCSSALTIPFAFQTGLRIGELIAIKESDISDDGKYLHIQRMAQRQAKRRSDGTWDYTEYKVVDHLKSSAGDRYVYLTEEARRIIDVVRQYNQEHGFEDDGHLFIYGGKRIKPRAVDCRLRKYCDRININRKSEHKIRKSYISTLIDAGININEIRKQAGHEDERTTYKSYCFNRKGRAENESDLEKALAI